MLKWNEFNVNLTKIAYLINHLELGIRPPAELLDVAIDVSQIRLREIQIPRYYLLPFLRLRFLIYRVKICGVIDINSLQMAVKWFKRRDIIPHINLFKRLPSPVDFFQK